jgi:hypothetical protein
MSTEMMARWGLALIGAATGVALWALVYGLDHGLLNKQLALVLFAFVGTFGATTLAMAGPIGLLRAARNGAALALAVAGLAALASLRYSDAEDFFNTPMPMLAVMTVGGLPVPFLIAAARPGWRDYPALFLESWSTVVRYAAAIAFTGLTWAVIDLSDAVLNLVGIELIGDLTDEPVVVMVLIGAILGFGMAVVHEMAALLSPYLVMRVFRMLLPVVLAVMVIFLAALPFRGLDGLFRDLSPAVLLLAMVAAGVSLVSITVDQSDAEAAASPLFRRTAQGMALLVPVLAGVAVWALWLRVVDYGWSPERLFLAVVGLIGLAYGLIYAVAVLRGPGWMARIRQGNFWMALAIIAVAALWLTPLLNAERISAQSQLARYVAGKTPAIELDTWALGRWGKPGEAALAELRQLAEQPGQEELAARLKGDPYPADVAEEALAEELAALMPLQPPTATGTRDTLLAQAEAYYILDWLEICRRKIETGAPACVMVVADLLPLRPGEEAMLVLERSADYTEVVGLQLNDAGFLSQQRILRADGHQIGAQEAAALLRAAQAAPLPLAPAMVNQLGTGESGLLMLP